MGKLKAYFFKVVTKEDDATFPLSDVLEKAAKKKPKERIVQLHGVALA